MESNDSQDRKGNRTRQKNKRGNSKVESNDSPEIPDRGETSDIPGLPSGKGRREIRKHGSCIYIQSPYFKAKTAHRIGSSSSHQQNYFTKQALVLIRISRQRLMEIYHHHRHHHHYQSLNREGRWGTTIEFATRFPHFLMEIKTR